MLSRRSSILLLIAVLAVLAGYVVYPSLQTFAEGLHIDNYRRLFAGWRSAGVRGLVNSVGISIASVAGAGLVGTGLALLFYRYTFPLRRLLQVMAVIPLALPPLVGVLAFLFLYGETGILPRALQALLGLDRPPFSFEGLSAVWLVHIYTMYVYFYLFCTASLKQLDKSVLEAATDLGARGGQLYLHILLPLLRPSMVAAGLLVFMISMASFTAPLLFAGTEPFMTLQIYNYKTNGDMALSATVSTVLTGICLVFLFLMEIRRTEHRTTASKGMAPAPLPVRSGWKRIAVGAFSAVIILLLLLPICTIVLISFAQEGSWTVQILPGAYTLSNYAALLSDPDVFGPIRNSLAMTTVATAGNLVFGVAAALIITKSGLPGRGFVRVLSVLPFAIPGTVIAVNLLLTFNEASVLSLGQILVGTYWILPLAYFVRHIPLVVRSTKASLESLDDRLAEASADLGAGTWGTLRRVVLPIIMPGIVAGGLLTFVTGLGEFVSSIMLYIYDNRPISVEILSQLRLYEFGSAAAYSVFLILLITGAALVAQRLGSGGALVAE